MNLDADIALAIRLADAAGEAIRPYFRTVGAERKEDATPVTLADRAAEEAMRRILAAEAPFTLEGHLLMLDHGAGLNSAFLHCSALLVKEGDAVTQGQTIGRIGATGRSTGPHLHWSLKWQEVRLDPLLFLPS